MLLKLQILSEAGVKWVGWAKTRLFALTDLRGKLAVSIMKKTWVLPDNIMVQVISSDLCDIIRIWGGAVGFIFHPRSSVYPGGFTPAGDAIPAVYGYPLVDDDHGSRLITGDTGAWTYDDDPPENYGNLDWIGADGVVVSWRGPAGRLLPMDSLNSYPGFTIFDYMTGALEIRHYTPYLNIVYQGGEALFEFPVTSKVLGATDTYVVLGVDYAGRENPEGDMNGFYTEVWRGVETRIGYLPDSRPTVPWFFNPSGTEAVSGGKKLVVDEEDKVIFSSLPSGAGTETKNMSQEDGSWELSRDGSWPAYRDFAADLMSGINLLVASNDISERSAGGATTSANFPIYYSGVQSINGFYPSVGVTYSAVNMCGVVVFTCSCATIDETGTVIAVSGCCESETVTAHDSAGNTVSREFTSTLDPVSVSGTEWIVVNAMYGLTNGVTPIAWSFDKGNIDSTGKVTSISGCGMGSITGTDACGRSANLNVRLPSGIWSEVSACSIGPASCGFGCNPQLISGDTRTSYTVHCCRDDESPVPYCGIYSGDTFGCDPCTPDGYTLYATAKYVYQWVCP